MKNEILTKISATVSTRESTLKTLKTLKSEKEVKNVKSDKSGKNYEVTDLKNIKTGNKIPKNEGKLIKNDTITNQPVVENSLSFAGFRGTVGASKPGTTPPKTTLGRDDCGTEEERGTRRRVECQMIQGKISRRGPSFGKKFVG